MSANRWRLDGGGAIDRARQLSFHFDGRDSAEALGLAQMRSCRGSIVEQVSWCRDRGHIS